MNDRPPGTGMNDRTPGTGMNDRPPGTGMNDRRRSGRTTSPGAGLWIAAVLAIALAVWATASQYPDMVRFGWSQSFEDLVIYRGAAVAARHSHDVYLLFYGWKNLPFTYPPFALLALGWTAALSERGAQIAALAANTVLLGVDCLVVCTALARRSARPWSRAAVAAAAGLLAAVCVELDPVRQTLGFGQINLLVLTLVLVDCVLVPVRRRGLLTGAATSLKLTPGIFLLYFFCTGQRRPALRQLVGAVATSLLAAALLPRSSLTYWTSRVFTNQTGPPAYAGNQSWVGFSDRLVHAPVPALVLTAALDLATVLVAARAVSVCSRRGCRLTAVAATGLTGLLLSPISWAHHWVWVLPLLAALVVERPFRGARATALVVVLIFRLPPTWGVPYILPAELSWTWWQTIIGNSYAFAAAGLLVALAFAVRPAPDSQVTAVAAPGP